MESVVITGIGLVTSVGHSAAQALTSLRAGIARFVEMPEYEPIVRDPAVHFPEPVTGSPVSGLTDGLVGIERLFALAVPALGEACSDAGLGDHDLEKTSLLVTGGERPDIAVGSRVATVFAPRLASRVSKANVTLTDYLPAGSAGFLLALRKGVDLLGQGVCRQSVIGGVDSWLDPASLAWLDERRRLKSLSSIDAFIPGEAAGFVVVELSSNAQRRKVRIYGKISDVSSAVEKHTISAETVCTGDALATCLKSAVADLEKRGTTAPMAYCDMNGESYRASEWAYACVKSFQGRHAVPQVFHPADCIGDVGSSMGPILIGLAVCKTGTNPVQSAPAIVWCSSDGGLRAACGVHPASARIS